MDVETMGEGEDEVEISEESTGTGPRLRIRSVGKAVELDLDPIELEGLTRLPFTSFPALGPAPGPALGPEPGPALGASPDLHQGGVGAQEAGLHILRNEFAMVGVSVTEEPDGPRLRVRDMASGAEILLPPEQLAKLTRLRHRDFAPLVDPSGLAAEEEPDPDQV
jgi:hypothetical protein